MFYSQSAATTVSVPVVTRRALVVYTCVVLVLALVFGGGTRQDSLGDGLVEIAALPLLAHGLVALRRAELSKPAWLAISMAGAVVALPLLQLVPLPPALWSRMPGRETFAESYRLIGIALPWLPISLDPAATWASFLTLIPPMAVFITVIGFSAAEKRRLLKVVVATMLLSVLMSCLQALGGVDSPLRFYELTNIDRAVGFFANANHNATFLMILLPLTIVSLSGADALFARRRIAIAFVMIAFAAIFVALALTHSRAGLALGLIGTVLSVVVSGGLALPGTRIRVLRYGIGAIVLGAFLAFQFGFLALSQRVENERLIQDLRWSIARVTLDSAKAYMPVGSGLGTFQPVYEMSAPRAMVRPAYVNHAHDDWLELWLEGGVPAALIVAAFLALYAGLTFAAFRRRPQDREVGAVALARAASVSILLILLHETVDYPLRTVAVLTLFAMSTAFLPLADVLHANAEARSE